MAELRLHHGTTQKDVVPTYGLGNHRHDYGRGFYLTDDLELAKEWSVYRPNVREGWVHTYMLKTDELTIIDFQEYDVLVWLAELMKHREASDSRRYRMLASRFIERYAIDTSHADVIRGWRANASYFYIAKEFVRDNVDIDILEDLLSLGGLGIQYCVKSRKAFSQLREFADELTSVEYKKYNARYNNRDAMARTKMRDLIDSDANRVTNVFSTLVGR